MKQYETIIIGGGVAGLAAALYLGRFERKTLLLTESFGGQTAIAGVIENYPGLAKVGGAELIQKTREQVAPLKSVQLKEGERVQKIERDEGGFVVAGTSQYQAKAVIIASGRRHRELGLPEEKGLIGKGLSYCATCDGPFARGKSIVVAGGGNAANRAVQTLQKIASKIHIVNLAPTMLGEKVVIEKIQNDPKITVINASKIVKIATAGGTVSGVEIEQVRNKSRQKIDCQMVFVEIGQVANSEPFKDFVKLNEQGEIAVGQHCQTSTAGVFAAGDVTDISAKQIVVAAGEGAKAAMTVNKYLDSA